MASEQEKADAILRDYELALEDLTFNSKPLINDLTMAADKYKPIAPKIVEKIEARLLEVVDLLRTLCCCISVFFVSLMYNFYIHVPSGRNTASLVISLLCKVATIVVFLPNSCLYWQSCTCLTCVCTIKFKT